MPKNQLQIGFVRRGYSASGGAESYLKRLAGGVVDAGFEARLFASPEWPEAQWPFGPITRLEGRSPVAFADALDASEAWSQCAGLMSLERVWRCDVFRAGDGVHRAWLERRSAGSAARKLLDKLSAKHRGALQLEKSLFADGGARRVIANSKMVKAEIIRFYGTDSNNIEVIYNGVPVAEFAPQKEFRDRRRAELGLSDRDVVILFAGSGWERKGLSAAIAAVESCADSHLHLLVAGRGNAGAFKSSRVRFLGAVTEMRSLYSAADLFILPTRYDPFSNACLEALAAGLPVITTSANGFSEMIEHGVHGSIVADPRDTRELADAIRDWSDPQRRDQARATNLKLAAQFDISTNVERTLRVLAQVAASAAST